jgi:hypothetical protein
VTTWLLGLGGALLLVAGAASLAYATVWRSSE